MVRKTAAERLEQRTRKQGTQASNRGDLESKRRKELSELERQLSKMQTELLVWRDKVLAAGDDIRWRSTNTSKPHFAGPDSTTLNAQYTAKQALIQTAKVKIENTKNVLDPGRKERLKQEKYQREQDHASKLMFWGKMLPSDDSSVRQGRSIMERLIDKEAVVIRRMNVGSLLCRDESGNPRFIRCYHSKSQECLPCDCEHVGNQFNLSVSSLKLQQLGQLVIDDSVLIQQRMALSMLATDALVPNRYLPNGPRDFDHVVWARHAKDSAA